MLWLREDELEDQFMEAEFKDEDIQKFWDEIIKSHFSSDLISKINCIKKLLKVYERFWSYGACDTNLVDKLKLSLGKNVYQTNEDIITLLMGALYNNIKTFCSKNEKSEDFFELIAIEKQFAKYLCIKDK